MSSPQMMRMFGFFWSFGAMRPPLDAGYTPGRATVGGETGPLPLERVDDLPVALHVHDDPLLRRRLVERLVQLPNVGLTVIAPLARGVRVVDEAHQARAGAGRGPLKHLVIPVGVAEGENWAAANERVDPHRLAGAVVDHGDLRFDGECR